MKRTLKFAAAASVAALFVVGMAAPSSAQQDNMAASSSQDYAYRYGDQPDATQAYVPAARGEYAEDAYAYAPLGPADAGSGCEMQGTYGKGTDYANCY